ncbi:tetratricopeptide repeat protein [Sphingosinicella sp. YJ22]|uniref:tetratricopeptide repeat protein n=1 Tax=Sphingosinicella sp. YJ22 TaxID=1104780 RepID=UPI00140773BE|nr:tetratricopeptide repeat protein [Sphingosinicella sp. YJ22]
MALLTLALALAACSSPTPQQSYETGVTAYRDGRMREARIAFMNVLQAEPNHVPARLMQARLFLDRGDGVAAEAELTRARQNGAPAADIRHLMAHARLLQGDPRGALELAAQATPEHQAYAARVTGLALLAAGDQLAAMQAFDRAVAADPNDSAVWLDIARFRRSIGDLGPALVATDRAVAANPRDSNALLMRGELTRSQYGLAAAIPWFDRALEVDPGNLAALLERASTNGDLGRMTAMVADSRAALALAPDHPLPYFLQATLAARARMYPLARTLYARTRGAYDRMPAGMMLSAVLAYEAEDYEGAAQRLTRLAELQPGNLKARRLLAAARLNMDDPAGAIAAARIIADRPDADSYTLSLVAAAFDRQGNGALAAQYRARAQRPQQASAPGWLWSDSSHPEVRAVGQLLVAGNLDEALQRARALQAEMPGAADAHLLAGDVMAARGDHGAAAEAYRRAANIAFTEPTAMRLINALERSGQGQAADGVLRLFESQNPRNLSAQTMLARRALLSGQWEEATARYERLRERIGNGDAALLNNLAWAHGGAGDDDLAYLYARRAWTLAPANPATAETLGWTLFRRGQVAEALALLSAARRGRPETVLLRPTEVAGR